MADWKEFASDDFDEDDDDDSLEESTGNNYNLKGNLSVWLQNPVQLYA